MGSKKLFLELFLLIYIADFQLFVGWFCLFFFVQDMTGCKSFTKDVLWHCNKLLSIKFK